MKVRMISIAMVGLATGLLLSTSHIQRVHADDQHEKACSEKTLHGSYGFYRTGTTSTGPLAALGILFFDGNGNSSGSQSISRNGVSLLIRQSPTRRMRWLQIALPGF